MLLQNLPVIDARVRKVVNASVILEGTHFAGLWFQAGSGTEGAPKSLLGLPCELIHQPGAPSGGRLTLHSRSRRLRKNGGLCEEASFHARP